VHAAEVGEDVRVGLCVVVGVGPMEFKLLRGLAAIPASPDCTLIGRWCGLATSAKGQTGTALRSWRTRTLESRWVG